MDPVGPQPKPIPRALPCPTCAHEHSFLPCDFCLCNAGGELVGIDTALGGAP